MKKSIIFLIFSVIVVFGISFADSPRIIYYTYEVNGRLVCDELTDKGNYIIRLYGKTGELPMEDYLLVDGMLNEPEHPVGISDSTGYFFILVNYPHFVDSVKFGIYISPDSTWFSEPIATEISRLQEITESYEKEGSGCSCSTVEPMETYTLKYEYRFPEVIINFCP